MRFEVTHRRVRVAQVPVLNDGSLVAQRRRHHLRGVVRMPRHRAAATVDALVAEIHQRLLRLEVPHDGDARARRRAENVLHLAIPLHARNVDRSLALDGRTDAGRVDAGQL